MIFKEFAKNGTTWMNALLDPSYDLTPYQHPAGYFGPLFKERNPPGLFRINEVDEAMDNINRGLPAFLVPPVFNRDVSDQVLQHELVRMQASSAFVQLIRMMAQKESGCLLNMPAHTFNTLPPVQRKGAKFVTAYGLFQYNRDAWRSEVKPFYAGNRKSTRLNSSHITISYAVFCLKKKKTKYTKKKKKTSQKK